ncbi:MAG: hypothetical protein R3F29_05565 [Planctomycetota bacterium]
MSPHEPVPGEDPERDDDDPGPGFVLAAGVVVYALMGAFALFWLWTRDRLWALPEQAVGRHGPFAASGVGLAVGLISAALLAWAMRRFVSVRELMSMAHKLFAKAGEATGLAFVLVAAVSEELFFRLAVQDALGLTGSVAGYVLLNSSVAGLRWLPITVLHALALGLIVDQGFGLLGSTTAHAVMNYLSLKRIQDP